MPIMLLRFYGPYNTECCRIITKEVGMNKFTRTCCCFVGRPEVQNLKSLGTFCYVLYEIILPKYADLVYYPSFFERFPNAKYERTFLF